MFDRWVYDLGDAEEATVRLRRLAEAYDFDADAAVQEFVNLTQTSTLTTKQAADVIVARMSQRRFPPLL